MFFQMMGEKSLTESIKGSRFKQNIPRGDLVFRRASTVARVDKGVLSLTVNSIPTNLM